MVLGKEVIDAKGESVGSVLDVGLHDLRRVKFLLVGDAAPIASRTAEDRFRRLSVDLIDTVDARVVLKERRPT